MAYVLRTSAAKPPFQKAGTGHDRGMSETNHFNSGGGWTRNVGLGVLVRLG
jgi:hypothetical protein